MDRKNYIRQGFCGCFSTIRASKNGAFLLRFLTNFRNTLFTLHVCYQSLSFSRQFLHMNRLRNLKFNFESVKKEEISPLCCFNPIAEYHSTLCLCFLTTLLSNSNIENVKPVAAHLLRSFLCANNNNRQRVKVTIVSDRMTNDDLVRV